MAKAEPGTDDAPAPVYDGRAGDEPLPVGVKLGSTRTVITTGDGDGIDVSKWLTRIATYEDVLTGEEKTLYGEEAEAEYPDRAEPIIETGLPDNYRRDLATNYFNELIERMELPANSLVVYAVPTVDNEEGLSNLEAVIEESDVGGALARSYPESLCGSIPAVGGGLEVLERTFLAVNMGSTYLEASTYRQGEQLTTYATGSVTGNDVDRWIVDYVEEETDGHVEIDLSTARKSKEEHADFDNFEPFTDVVPQPDGGPFEFTIEKAVMDACGEYLDDVVDEFANSFLPKLATDYRRVFGHAMANPIVLTGGMACIPGIVDEFEKRLTAKLQGNVDATAPDHPEQAAAEGAHRLAYRLVEQDVY